MTDKQKELAAIADEMSQNCRCCLDAKKAVEEIWWLRKLLQIHNENRPHTPWCDCDDC